MIEYLSYLILGVLTLLVIIACILIRKRATIMDEEILDAAVGKDKLKKEHIAVAMRIHEKLKEIKEREPIAIGFKALDEYAMIFLGYGGIFKLAAKKGTFSARELAVESDISLETVRKWVQEARLRGIINIVETPHKIFKFCIVRESVERVLKELADRVSNLLNIREPLPELESEETYDEAFEVMRQVLGIIIPLKENFSRLISMRSFNENTLMQIGLQRPIINRWIDEGIRLRILEEIRENEYRVNYQNLLRLISKFHGSVLSILRNIK